jgi:imidazole glycerol-phosphate synthase subunit HisF
MLKPRLIPVVLLKDGYVVQSKGFRRHQRLGNPLTIVQRLSSWESDELIYLDISRGTSYDLGRDDLGDPNLRSIDEIISHVAKHCFMPLTFGGQITTIERAAKFVRLGADKISVNSKPLEDPDFISECSREFGAQCVVVSIDAKRNPDGGLEVYSDRGRNPTGRDPAEWASEAENRGAGEIIINSIDRDGAMTGYDLELVKAVVNAVGIPVIALGGVGKWNDFAAGLEEGGASAVAAGNIFHYTENSVYNFKKRLYEAGAGVRAPSLI